VADHGRTDVLQIGERGSIDVLGIKPDRLAAAVCEVKSAFGSLEETNRSVDAKVRLTPTLVHDQVGWRPRVMGRFLVVPRDTSIRRAVERHSATMHSLYPGRTPEVRAWLHNPKQGLGAIWFVDPG
jgi:hypothetical protein